MRLREDGEAADDQQRDGREEAAQTKLIASSCMAAP
jgi:hypothetical protein